MVGLLTSQYCFCFFVCLILFGWYKVFVLNIENVGLLLTFVIYTRNSFKET